MATGSNADVSGEAGLIPLDLNFNHAFENLGAATSSASTNAPITFTIGDKQVLSGSSTAGATSNFVKILVTIAGVAGLLYFLQKGGK